MRTSKAFSTISYNTNDFLHRRLNDFVHNGTLQFWAFINHKAEDEERKDHIHLYMYPDGLVDTSMLKHEFDELHNDGTTDGCKLFKPSDWGNWYLYVIHDPCYLACKYELEKPKKYRYDPSAIICSDTDIMQQFMEHMNYTELMSPSFKLIREHATQGIPMIKFLELFPVKKCEIRYVKEIYQLYGGNLQ